MWQRTLEIPAPEVSDVYIFFSFSQNKILDVCVFVCIFVCVPVHMCVLMVGCQARLRQED